MAEGGRGPKGPTDIPRKGWWATLKRTFGAVREKQATDRAAGLTYYAVLALFPALIVLVAILGLVGQEGTIDALIDTVEDVGSEQAAEAVRGPLEGVIANRGGAGALLGVGLIAALWSASNYISAFSRAGNEVWEVREGRPFWRLKPLQIGLTIVMVLLLAIVAVALVVTGPLARGLGDAIGLGDTAVLAWDIAKWPVLIAIVAGMIALLYHVAPNVRQPSMRWVSPGSAVALVAWIVASALFAVYVANFGNYNATYGTLGGAIVLLLWLWITNLAILLGAHFDAELEREREIRSGQPAHGDLQLPEKQPAPRN